MCLFALFLALFTQPVLVDVLIHAMKKSYSHFEPTMKIYARMPQTIWNRKFSVLGRYTFCFVTSSSGLESIPLASVATQNKLSRLVITASTKRLNAIQFQSHTPSIRLGFEGLLWNTIQSASRLLRIFFTNSALTVEVLRIELSVLFWKLLFFYRLEFYWYCLNFFYELKMY